MNFATLQHSVFLQALGNAILNSLWQAFIIWIIYETINISYKNASSIFKNRVSTFLIFIAFGWFILSLITGFYHDENLSPIVFNPASIGTAETSKEAALNIQAVLSYITGSLPYLSISYIFLLAFLMFKLFSSYRYVYFIANRRLQSPPFELQHFASKVATQLNISKKISVWISHHVDVPATIGFLKPVILIPFASINNLSSHQLEAIILHELSHIKRNDYVINLFISVIETILFFNPFILLLAKVIKRERENCCDDFVIQYRYDPHSYASALLRLEQSRRSNLQLAMGAVSGKKQLLTRVKRITNNQIASKQFNYGQKLLALLLVTFIVCSVAWLSPQDKKQNIGKPSSSSENLEAPAKPTLPLPAPRVEKKEIGTSLSEIKIPKENPTRNSRQSISQLSLTGDNSGAAEFDLVKESSDFGEKESDNQDKEFYFLGADSKNPKVFFDQKVLKYVPLKLLEDFSLQKMNIHIDVDELNKNLEEAYKGINSMDWQKIQNDINASLSRLKGDKSSRKEMSELYQEGLKQLLEAKIEKKAKSDPKTISTELWKKMVTIDSLRNYEVAPAHRRLPTNEVWEQIQQSRNFQGNSGDFYKYEPAPLNWGYNDLPKNNFPPGISIKGLKSKNAKIIIGNLTHTDNESKSSFHYVITDSSSTEKRKVITIEVNNIP
ncbi:MAG: M56 family metallopeptidase [Ginsengibacter sp.]